MVLVDSSVWIDFFKGRLTPATIRLRELIRSSKLLTGDLVLTEVLQGFNTERDFNTALRLLGQFATITIGGREIAVQAARNYRTLRARGVTTVRKTIDALIATRCIVDGHRLLYTDRDFDPFVEHLGLMPAI